MDDGHYEFQEEPDTRKEDVSVLELLTSAWRNEAAAPEILEYAGDLVDRIQTELEDREEAQSSQADPMAIMTRELTRMDLQRAKFVLRNYLRARLVKLERHILHILGDTRSHQRLSPAEKQFADRFVETLAPHLENSVLSRLPVKYQSLMKQSETSETNDMITLPQKDKFVACRSQAPLGNLVVDTEDGDAVDLKEGDLYVLPYQAIEALLHTKEIQLL